MSGDKPTIEPPQVRNPKLWLDPDTIRFKDLYKYVSLDTYKIRQSIRNYKGSIPYIGGILAACLVAKIYVDGAVKDYIFGENGNGGDFLTMYTRNNTTDYYYNREFQRMRYLTEESAGNDASVRTSDRLLTDLGHPVTSKGLNTTVLKKSPHFKYF